MKMKSNNTIGTESGVILVMTKIILYNSWEEPTMQNMSKKHWYTVF